jgi:hypothetical protein
MLVSVPGVYADTVALRLSDNLGNSVLINDTDNDGIVAFSGNIGAWDINVSVGAGSALLGPGKMDLYSVNTSSTGTASILSIAFTQTDMTQVFPGWNLKLGGTAVNLQSVSYSAWADNANGAFATTGASVTHIGTVGPFNPAPASYSGSVTGLVAGLTANYSLTQQIQVQGIRGVANSFGGDAEITPVPESSSLIMLGIALLGVGVVSNRRSLLNLAGK